MENFAVLHHEKMEEQKEKLNLKKEDVENKILDGILPVEEGYERVKKLYEDLFQYYASLKDTALICNKCHLEIHPHMKKSPQKL